MIGFHLEVAMNFTKTLLAAAAVSLTVVCMPHADTATPTTIDGLKGYTLRVLHPGDMMTMDYREDRVNIHVDKDNKITEVTFH
jgi:hypothetical protein